MLWQVLADLGPMQAAIAFISPLKAPSFMWLASQAYKAFGNNVVITSAFLCAGIGRFRRMFTLVVVSLKRLVLVVVRWALVVLMWLPMSRVCSVTGMVVLSTDQLCLRSHALELGCVAKV